MIAYTNIIATIENFAVSSRIMYIAPSQSKFILFDLLITVNFSKYEKTLYYTSCIWVKKYLVIAFIKMNIFVKFEDNGLIFLILNLIKKKCYNVTTVTRLSHIS